MLNSYILALGSNHFPKRNLAHARDFLYTIFSTIHFSSELENEPIDMPPSTPFFINQLAYCKSHYSLEEIQPLLKKKEKELGRNEIEKLLITIDLDIISYNKIRLKPIDFQRAYVQSLLKEIRNYQAIIEDQF